METAERVRRFTVAEYHLMAEAGVLRSDERTELLDGTVVEMSPIGDRHGMRHTQIVRNLIERYGARLEVHGQSSFPIGTENEPQPDIAIGPRVAYAVPERKPHAHELFATIELSEGSIGVDLGPKMRLYARGRVPNYLVVDLVRDVVIVHGAPHDLGYGHVETYGRGERFELDGSDEIVLEADLFLSPS